MRILTRYLLKAHLGPFLFALLALTGILFVNVIAQRFEQFAGKGLPAGVILEVFLLSFPHILALTLPMAVLVSVLYAFATLAAENEITALKASGANLIRTILPLIVVSVLIAGFMVWFNDRLLPDANHRLKNLLVDVTAKTPTLDLKEQIVNPIRTQDFRTRYWLRAAEIDDRTRRMTDVVIYDLSEPGRTRTVYADSGRMAMNASQTDLMLTLYDGHMREVSDDTRNELQRVAFAEQRVELKGVGTELQRSSEEHRSDREMSIALLRAEVDSAQRQLAELKARAAGVHGATLDRVLDGPNADFVTDLDLYAQFERPLQPHPFAGGPLQVSGDDVIDQAVEDAHTLANTARNLQLQINRNQVEVHKKFAIPIACIIFVLIGAPLAVRFPRGGVGMVIAASLTIFAIYYMSLMGGESLGDRGVISPFWGPWAPNLLFGAISLWALSRIGRETATSRGGGWDDLWATVRQLVPQRRRRGETGAS